MGTHYNADCEIDANILILNNDSVTDLTSYVAQLA